MKKTLVILALSLAMAFPAHAGIQQVRVFAVGVDNLSTAAQAAAVEYAKKRAVYLVAMKMEIDNASARVAAIKPEDWDRIVRGATVLNSWRNKEFTYANVTVSIVDTELRRALDLPKADPTTLGEALPAVRNILALPVYKTAERAYLWEDENILRDPMRSEVLRQTHGSVLVPAGDFEDRRLIDYANIATATGEELTAMFDRYGVDEILIVIATPGAPNTLEPTHVTLRRLTRKEMRVEVMNVPIAGEKDTLDMRIQTAANAIGTAVAQIATATSKDEQQALAKNTAVPVVFAYANPRELGQMQQSVRTIRGVKALEIPTITLREVSGTIYFDGAADDLKEALSKKGVIVTQGSGNWTLSLR